jgi:hypothetical protein
VQITTRSPPLQKPKDKNMASKGFFNAFADVWMHEGVRTPMVDYCGALGHISPTDLGIKAAREALKRAGIAPTEIGSVITGNMAPGDFAARSARHHDPAHLRHRL